MTTVVNGIDVIIMNNKKYGPCVYAYVDDKWKFLCYFKGDKYTIEELAHQAYCAMYYNY